MQPFPHPSDATHKMWSRLANWLQRYSSLKVWTTGDGPLVYYKLTLWSFGSGELKIHLIFLELWPFGHFKLVSKISRKLCELMAWNLISWYSAVAYVTKICFRSFRLLIRVQGHWWGFISRNYVVWPIFLLMNVFIALKGSHFWFLFDFTAAGVVPCGGRKTSPRTSTIVQFIFYFGPLRPAIIFWEIWNKWLV